MPGAPRGPRVGAAYSRRPIASTGRVRMASLAGIMMDDTAMSAVTARIPR